MNLALKGLALAVSLGFASLTTGCIGNIRDTTTPRTSTEMLLVSTAAERAVEQFDTSPLSGKRVFIDGTHFESVDKAYVLSALRDHLMRNDVTINGSLESTAGEGEEPNGADLVLEIRNGSLGLWDGDFVLGIPAMPIGAQGMAATTPPLYLFRRLSAQGWAKFQFWIYDPVTNEHVYFSPDLWGHTFYNQWWWFGIGPFDGSNDVYPEADLIPMD